MKKILEVALVAFVLFSAVIACQKETVSNKKQQTLNPEGTQNLNMNVYPIVSKKISVKTMGAKQVVQGEWAQLDVMKKMEQITNIVLDFYTPVSTNYEEKKNMAFASGDVPDVFFGGMLSLEDEELYGSQGILIPLEGLIEKYSPNLKKFLDKETQIKKDITSLDGHIYALPYIVRTKTAPAFLLYINTKWLESTNMLMPTSTDDFYMVLEAFKRKDPNRNGKADEIPLSAVKMGMLHGTILSAFGDAGGGPQPLGAKYSSGGFTVKDGKVIYSALQPYYKEYLEYMRKLYAEGFLDNQTFTQSMQQMTAKGKEGKLGVLTAPPSNLLNSNSTDEYLVIPPLTSHVNKKQITKELKGITTGTFAITNKCKYPEAMMRWVDIFYRDPENALEGVSGMSMFLGIQGVNWEFTDSQKTSYRRIIKDKNMNPLENTNKFYTPGGATACPSKVITDAVPEGDRFLELKARECEKKYFPYMVPVFPQTVRYTKDESERIAFLQNDIDSYVEQMTAKFIIGEELLDKWDEYINILKKMNIDELTKIKQDAYDRWNLAK